MADITVTAADVRPLPGAVIERYDLGAAADVGEVVYMVSDGDVEQTDANAAGTTYGIGVIVALHHGGTTGAAGDTADVAVAGRVTGFSGMTVGDVLYISDTTGALADAAGTTEHKFARARSATTIFINVPMTEA